MDFNFDRLNNISTPQYTQDGTAAKKPTKTPPEPLLIDKQYKSINKPKNAIQGEIRQNREHSKNTSKVEKTKEPLPALNILRRKADQSADDRQRAAAAYRQYQDNISAAGQLTTDIIKGLNTGQDIYDLFLMATKAIGCMTGDNYIYNHAKETIKTIYGYVLEQSTPLKIELAAVSDRLCSLEEAALWADEPGEKQRIENAVKWHRKRQAELVGKIDKTQL